MLPAITLPEGLDPRDPDAPSVSMVSRGIWRYRPSSLGSCLRALFAERTGYQPVVRSERNQRILDEGKLHEPLILEQVELAGWKLMPRPPLLAMRVGDYAEIVGEPDGLAQDSEGNYWLVECKTAGETNTHSTFRNLVLALSKGWPSLVETDYAYAFQVTTYSALIFACYGIAVKGVIWALKNRNDGEYHIQPLEGLPFDMEAPAARVALVEALALSNPDKMPACDVFSPFCKFRYLHDRKESVRNDDLADLAESYARAQKLEAYWKKEKAAVKPQLEQATRGEPKTVAGAFSIVWTQEHSTAFDRAAAEKHDPDFLKPYLREVVSTELDLEALERDHPDFVARFRKPARSSSMRVYAPKGWDPNA